MQRILNSNQPVAWAFVPVTGLVLFLLAGAMDPSVLASWPGWFGIMAAARLLHLLHLESGMRTRPDSFPSWAWALMATPFLGDVSEVSWWACCCLFMGLRFLMRLRDTDSSPGSFLFIGMWWGLAFLLEALMWPWLPVCMIPAVLLKRPSAAEWMAWLMGLLAPLIFAATGVWLMEGVLRPCWGWNPVDGGFNLPILIGVLLPMGLGWVVRQQSLVRATAQQRFSRQLTQWLGALGLLACGGLYAGNMVMGGGWMEARSVIPSVWSFLAAWSLPWLLPPGFRITRWMPYLFLLMSAGLVLLRWGTF